MAMNPTKETAIEVCKVLDALSALSVDLSCHNEVLPDKLVLSVQRTRDTCAAIDEAVSALKKILEISVASGGGPIPPEVAEQLDGSGTPTCPIVEPRQSRSGDSTD